MVCVNVPLNFLSNSCLEQKTLLMLPIHKIWEDKTVSGDFKNTNIVMIEDCSLCENYRDIFILSTTDKIFAQILLNQFLVIEEILPESAHSAKTIVESFSWA